MKFRIELLAGALLAVTLGQPAIAQNMAITTQFGMGNHSTISQFGSNRTNVIQFGVTNTSSVSQFNGPNQTNVAQVGVDNTSSVSQSGSHDVAAVVQQGEGNDGTITQTTDHQTTMVFQSSNPFGVNRSMSNTVSSSLGSVSVQFTTHSN